MEPEVTSKQYWVEIDGTEGMVFVPADIISKDARKVIKKAEETGNYKAFADFYSGEIWSVEVAYGYGVRLSASGYMDCTEWTVYTNKREAIQAARELMRED